MEFERFQINNVRAEMARKNITIKKMAKILGLSTNSLSNKLNGKSDFKVREIERIALILDVQLEIFFN